MSTSVETGPRNLASRLPEIPPLMLFYIRWTLIFFTLSVLFHCFHYFVRHDQGYMAYPFQLNSTRFADFWVFQEKFTHFHTQDFFVNYHNISYPYAAPMAPIFEFFFKFFAPHSTAAFAIFILISFVVSAVLFGRHLVRFGIAQRRVWLYIAIVWTLTWPVLLILDGGNCEVVVWITMAIAMWAYATGREWTAAIFFGLAASLKYFPFVFLALFLSRRKFPKLLAGAGAYVLITLVSLAILGPTVPAAWKGINFDLDFFRVNYMAQWHVIENSVDHSLFALIKYILVNLFHHSPTDFLGWLRGYMMVASVGGILLYFTYIRRLPLLNQVLLLVIVSIWFTPFSGDGTLIHLCAPLAMLYLLAIQAWRDGVTIPGLKIVFACLVFCLSIESFMDYRGVRFIGQAHSVALGILFLVALRYRLGPPLSEGLGGIVLSRPVTAWAVRDVQVTQPH